MFLKRIFIDVESKSLIEVFEEDTPHIVTLADDNCVLFAQLIKVGKGWAKHRMSAYIRVSTLFIERFQTRLHTGYIADNTLCRQTRQHFFESCKRVFHGYSIDYQLGCKGLNLIQLCETLAVIGETHTLCILFINRHLMLKTKQVDEETPHLSCPHNQYFHAY